MRSTPSKSDPALAERPTRPAQNWQRRRREPATADVETMPESQDARPSCLTTVVLGDAILDFEAYAIVIGAERYFLPVRQFWIAAALLFAEGEEVPATYLALISRGALTQNIVHWVSREIRLLKSRVLSCKSGVLVSGTGRSYRLTRTGRSG